MNEVFCLIYNTIMKKIKKIIGKLMLGGYMFIVVMVTIIGVLYVSVALAQPGQEPIYTVLFKNMLLDSSENITTRENSLIDNITWSGLESQLENDLPELAVDEAALADQVEWSNIDNIPSNSERCTTSFY